MSKSAKLVLRILGGGLMVLGLLFLLEYALLGAMCIALGAFIVRLTISAIEKREVKATFEELRVLPSQYVVIDTETTGLDPAQCEIIEIAAIRYSEGVEIDRFHSYIKPSGKIPRRITELTGITNADVRNAPRPDVVVTALIDFVGEDAIAGYNVKFDVSFIQTRLGVSFPGGAFDALQAARENIRGVKNYKLQTLKEHLGLKTESHNATADCETTQAVITYCRRIQTKRAEEDRRYEAMKEHIIEEADNASEGCIQRVELFRQYSDTEKQLAERAVNALIEEGKIVRDKVGNRIVFKVIK